MGRTPAYVIISWVFFVLIGMGFAYSYFFYPDRHPVDCVVKSYTGKDCPTCGFSHAFSYYSRGQLAQGRLFNPLSWPVFLFFVFQLVARLYVLIHYYKGRRGFQQWFITWDVIISISFFLLAFLPIILNI